MLRADALKVARDVLVVKAGRFAERAPEAYDLIRVAEYILHGDPELLLDGIGIPVGRIDAALAEQADKGIHLVRGEE